MYRSTFARCASEISGPHSVSGSMPLPSRIRSARAASSFTKLSCSESCTISRAPAEHTCPECRNAAVSALSTTVSKSVPSNTMLGFLPPSSSATRRTPCAAEAMIFSPVASPPVNEIRSTPGCATSACPAVPPWPSSRFSTPGGMSASSNSPTRATVDSGVSSLGLITVVLPAASAGASFQEICSSG